MCRNDKGNDKGGDWPLKRCESHVRALMCEEDDIYSASRYLIPTASNLTCVHIRTSQAFNDGSMMGNAPSRTGAEYKLIKSVPEEHITLYSYWSANPKKKLKQV